MSWLSDFTSKAENLLTKFDQTAAQTLNESGLQNTNESVVASGQSSTATSQSEATNIKEYQNASPLFSSQPNQTTQVSSGNLAVDSGIFITVKYRKLV